MAFPLNPDQAITKLPITNNLSIAVIPIPSFRHQEKSISNINTVAITLNGLNANATIQITLLALDYSTCLSVLLCQFYNKL